jgi:S1-C subfamily serine protease
MVIVAAIVGALLGSAGSFVAFKATTPPAATAGSSAPAATTGLLPTLAPAASGGAMSVTQAAAKASPSVVTIITSDQVNQGPFSQQTQGVGSGIIFDSHGWILTNRHVVEGATSVTVQLADGRQFPGTVYGSDTLTDLAIVKVDATGWPAASVGESNDLAIGQSVIAIGSPLGDFTNTVTTGIVSALQRSLTLSNESLTGLIQTDAAINPGNSGGPLLDAAGNVIGVNTATASSAEGISFAIPIDMARPMMVQALAGKPLARAWLGVSFEPVDAGLAQQQKLGSTSGAWITAANGGSAVVTGGPAAQAGLKAGDIILSVQGVAVNNSHGLDVLIASYAPGETVTVKVLRGGSTLDVTVTLGTRPANLQG